MIALTRSLIGFRFEKHAYIERGAIVVLLLGLLGACSESQKPDSEFNDPSLFWKLELNHHAVTLSTTTPYDTLRLTAVPRNYAGDIVPDLPAPQYVSTDLTKVKVDSGGLLTAAGVTSTPVAVIATITTPDLKHLDTVFVKVSATAPVLVNFSVHPLPPDSAKVASAFSVVDGATPPEQRFPNDTLIARATDAADVLFDNLIPGRIPVYFWSSDPTIARINRSSGVVAGLRPGFVTLYATTTVFGVSKTDTLPYRIGYPIFAVIKIGDPVATPATPVARFLQPEFWVGAGASVVWDHALVFRLLQTGALLTLPTVPFTAPNVDVVFSEASLPNITASSNGFFSAGLNYCSSFQAAFTDCAGAGNFVLGGFYTPNQASPFLSLAAVRGFPVPATYEYHSTILGAHGKIVVVDER